MRLTIPILFIVVIFGPTRALSAPAEIVEVPVRPGVTMRYLTINPGGPPKVAVILLAGGNGALRLSPAGAIGSLGRNFLIRSRELFARQGFFVAALDVASDHKIGMNGAIRMSPQHAEDLGRVIADVRNRTGGAAVWLVGTSAGTLSAANAGARLSGAHPSMAPAGIVFTSTMTTLGATECGKTVYEAALAEIRVPVLVVSHENDGCPCSPGSAAVGTRLLAACVRAPAKELKVFSGGSPPVSPPCEAQSAHGFLGIEESVVEFIADWIKRHLLLRGRGAGAVGAISEVWGDLQRAAGATERLLELLETRPEIFAPANPAPAPRAVRTVEFDAVTFAYPSRPDTPALQRFSLRLGAGERVALVGPSGAGKSTVLALLLRFYEPQSGAVRIDGVDIRDMDPRELRRLIAVVPQEPVIFAASVLCNVRYGRAEASLADAERACERAFALEFIERLPQRFYTQLGERGVTLSGGQRQRLSIARALLADRPILLLDEATSSLDAASERMVQQAMQALERGRTTLVIAHRLATVQHADRIVVMDRGAIVAQGTHAELMKQGGLYAGLAALQFLDTGPRRLERVA